MRSGAVKGKTSTIPPRTASPRPGLAVAERHDLDIVRSTWAPVTCHGLAVLQPACREAPVETMTAARPAPLHPFAQAPQPPHELQSAGPWFLRRGLPARTAGSPRRGRADLAGPIQAAYFMGEALRCCAVRYGHDDGPPSAVLGNRCDRKALGGITNRDGAFGPDGQRSESPVPVGQRERAGEGGRAKQRARSPRLFELKTTLLNHYRALLNY